MPKWQQLPMETFLTVWRWSFWSARCGALGLLDLVHYSRSKRSGLIGGAQSAFRFYSPSVLGHQPVEVEKGELQIGLQLTNGLRYWQGTYNVIRNFIVRVNHAAVSMSWYLEQMLLPFLMLIQLSNRKSWRLGDSWESSCTSSWVLR